MKDSNRPKTESFETAPKSTAAEVWLLSALFVLIIGSLLHFQSQQQRSHSEVARQTDPTGVQKGTELTRNKTPALGL